MDDLLKKIENLGQEHEYLGFKKDNNLYYLFELYNKKIEEFISEFISSLANDKDTELRYLKEITEVLFKELQNKRIHQIKLQELKAKSKSSTDKKKALDLSSKQVNDLEIFDKNFNSASDNSTTKKEVLDLLSKQVNDLKDLDKKINLASDNSTTKKQVLDLVSKQVNDLKDLDKKINLASDNSTDKKKALDKDFNLKKALVVLDSTLNGFVKKIDPKVDLDNLIKKDFNLYKAVIAAGSGTTVEAINIEEQEISDTFDPACEEMYNLARDMYNEFQKLNEGIYSTSMPLENREAITQKRQELLEKINKLDVNIKEQVANKKAALDKYHNTLKDKYDFENNQGSIQEAKASFFTNKIKYLKRVAEHLESIKPWIDSQNKLSESETASTATTNLETLMMKNRRGVYHKLVEGKEKYVVSSKKAVDNRYKISVVEINGKNKEETILFDPNKPITFGEKFKDENLSLDKVDYSPDGKYAVYRIKINDTDECRINVCDIEETLKARKKNEDAPIVNTATEFEHLIASNFRVTWTADSKSFFYEQASQGQNEDGQSCIWYDLVEHKISDKSFKNDKTVIKVEKKDTYEVMSAPLLLPDNNGSLKQTHFHVYSTGKDYRQVYTIDQERNKELFFDGSTYGSQGKVEQGKGDGRLEILCKFNENYLIAKTNYNAPYNRLVLIDAKNPDPKNWKTLSKPNDTRVLHEASLYFVGAGKTPKIKLHYEVDTASHNEIYDIEGIKRREGIEGVEVEGPDGDIKLSADPKVITLPKDKDEDKDNSYQTLQQVGRAKPGDTKVEMIFNSMSTASGDIYQYDFEKDDTTLKHQEEHETGDIIDPSKIIVERLWTESKDGTRIPMTVYRRPDTELDGTAALRMFGYGGFKFKLKPAYSSVIHNFINEGGIFVTTNIRGGGEYGENWHKGGILENKQNTFDDFIACAEALQGDRPYGIGYKDEEGKTLLPKDQQQIYTSKKRMIIDGRSNGGLLTAVCAIQRPDLFAVVSSFAALMDMKRFNEFVAGKHWEAEFGRGNTNLLAYLVKEAYSPVHQGEKLKNLPHMLVQVGAHDDRVDISHSLKFVASAQKHGNTNVTLKVVDGLAHDPISAKAKKGIQVETVLLNFIIRTIGPINQNAYKNKLEAEALKANEAADQNQGQLSKTDFLAFTAQPQLPITPIAPVEEPRRKSFVTRSNLFQTPCKGKGF